LAAIGLSLSTLLMFGPVHITSGLTFDLNSFLAACLLTVIGVQVVTFGALARYYATITGMLPRGPRSDYILAWCKTDRLAVIALGLVAAGGAVFGYSLIEWARVDFGNLVNPLVPRLVAAGLSITVIGIQTAFVAFLFGILSIPVRGGRSA
jgi:hypothetical protein